jgi:hypothetical protein
MFEYRVRLVRSADLTNAERRARLGRVYRFLLGLADRASVRDEVDGSARTAAARPISLRGDKAQGRG